MRNKVYKELMHYLQLMNTPEGISDVALEMVEADYSSAVYESNKMYKIAALKRKKRDAEAFMDAALEPARDSLQDRK